VMSAEERACVRGVYCYPRSAGGHVGRVVPCEARMGSGGRRGRRLRTVSMARASAWWWKGDDYPETRLPRRLRGAWAGQMRDGTT